MQQSPYRWVIVAAGGFLGCLAMGAMFSLPVFLVPMAEATGWSRTGISSAMTIGFLTMAASALGWGLLLDRFGLCDPHRKHPRKAQEKKIESQKDDRALDQGAQKFPASHRKRDAPNDGRLAITLGEILHLDGVVAHGRPNLELSSVPFSG